MSAIIFKHAHRSIFKGFVSAAPPFFPPAPVLHDRRAYWLSAIHLLNTSVLRSVRSLSSKASCAMPAPASEQLVHRLTGASMPGVGRGE